MSTGQREAVFFGWVDNRTSGVALTMRHRLWVYIHLRSQWPQEGRWVSAYTL